MKLSITIIVLCSTTCRTVSVPPPNVACLHSYFEDDDPITVDEIARAQNREQQELSRHLAHSFLDTLFDNISYDTVEMQQLSSPQILSLRDCFLFGKYSLDTLKTAKEICGKIGFTALQDRLTKFLT